MSTGTGKPKVRIWWVVGCVCAVLVLVRVGVGVAYEVEEFTRGKKLIHKYPFLNMTPVPLADLKSSSTTGEELEYWGVKFRTPWGPLAPAPAGVKIVGSYTRIQFKDGQFMMALRDFGPNGVLDVLEV